MVSVIIDAKAGLGIRRALQPACGRQAETFFCMRTPFRMVDIPLYFRLNTYFDNGL
jgi:hypothetical protein